MGKPIAPVIKGERGDMKILGNLLSKAIALILITQVFNWWKSGEI